ncbi:hypothetical protein ElyMa_004009600, partial [Elysia marginata]
ALKDLYGDYKWTYIFTGTSLALSGCMVASCLLIAFIKNRRRSNSEDGTAHGSWRPSCGCIPYDVLLWTKRSYLRAHAWFPCSKTSQEDDNSRTPLINKEISEVAKDAMSEAETVEHTPLLQRENEKDSEENVK